MSLFDIQNVTVGPRNLTARVRLANGAPVRTAEDIEGTNRVYQLMPQIADHACVSPQGDVFRDVLGARVGHHALVPQRRAGLGGAFECRVDHGVGLFGRCGPRTRR